MAPLGHHFAWHCQPDSEPVSHDAALTRAILYHSIAARPGYYCCQCALYNFFFLGFRQWQSRADRVLTLISLVGTSDLHCFGALGVGHLCGHGACQWA